MIKKIVILALIAWGLFVFYRKFVAPTAEPFFNSSQGNVDLFGLSSPYTDK